MKIFLPILTLFAVSSVGSVTLTIEQKNQCSAEFLKILTKLQRVFLKQELDFDSSATWQKLGLPAALELVVQNMLGKSDNPQLQKVAREEFIQEVTRIYELIESIDHGKSIVCEASINEQELLALLGVSDTLKETVAMTTNWYCGSSGDAVVKRSTGWSSALVKRDWGWFNGWSGFLDTVGEIFGGIKSFATKHSEKLCTLADVVVGILMDDLKLDSLLLSLADKALSWFCDTDDSVDTAEALKQYNMWCEFVTRKMSLYMDTKGDVCRLDLQELREELIVSDIIEGALKKLRDEFCVKNMD